MERIFTNSGNGPLAGVSDLGDVDQESYEYTVLSLIQDAVSYEESDLSPNRETAQRYYYGLEPTLSGKESLDLTGDPPVDEDDDINRSTVVSTDVKDTVMTILPSLMRIFGGTEHALEYIPTSEQTADMAAQMTDYIRHLIWTKNDGFNILYGTFKDALTVRTGIITWWTDNNTKVTEKTYKELTRNELTLLMTEAVESGLRPEIVSWDGNGMRDGEHTVLNITIRHTEVKPKTQIRGVPPEEFRVNRSAKSVDDAQIIGYECYVRVSDLIEDGVSRELAESKMGSYANWSEEKYLRNPGWGTDYNLNDYVRYGCYYVRADKDGDGINELRHIVTIGEDYEIIQDDIVDRVKFAFFTPDPTPHTLVGDSAADLVMDIQKINTNLLRAGMDSLSQSIFPRTAFNQLAVDVNDILDDSVGGPIRVRGNPMENILSISTPFVGEAAFKAKSQMDLIRQQRTGISEASKGLDPRAMQSTNIVGVEAILTGAQERIELIALVFAHTGMKQLYEGLLQEVVDNAPNRTEVLKLRGKFVNINPSLFDASLSVEVNSSLGKGSDQARLMALEGVAQKQMMVIEKYGMGNGIVGPVELRNTIVDILALNNIKNATRYFREVTPEMAQAMESAPQEPPPEMVLAKASLEDVRTKGAIALGKQKQEDRKIEVNAALDAAAIDQKRDETTIDALLRLVEIAQTGILASEEANEVVEEEVEPRNQNG